MKVRVDLEERYLWYAQETDSEEGTEIDVPDDVVARWRRVQHEHMLVDLEIEQEVERQH